MNRIQSGKKQASFIRGLSFHLAGRMNTKQTMTTYAINKSQRYTQRENRMNVNIIAWEYIFIKEESNASWRPSAILEIANTSLSIPLCVPSLLHPTRRGNILFIRLIMQGDETKV